MARHIGPLSVSMAALGLAMTAYFAQGAGADVAPVEIAEFGTSPAAVTAAAGGDEYDMLPGESALFHPTAARQAKPCQKGAGLATLKIADEIGVLCLDGAVLGYLVTVEGQPPKVVPEIGLESGKIADEACPSKNGRHDEPGA